MDSFKLAFSEKRQLLESKFWTFNCREGRKNDEHKEVTNWSTARSKGHCWHWALMRRYPSTMVGSWWIQTVPIYINIFYPCEMFFPPRDPHSTSWHKNCQSSRDQHQQLQQHKSEAARVYSCFASAAMQFMNWPAVCDQGARMARNAGHVSSYQKQRHAGSWQLLSFDISCWMAMTVPCTIPGCSNIILQGVSFFLNVLKPFLSTLTVAKRLKVPDSWGENRKRRKQRMLCSSPSWQPLETATKLRISGEKTSRW